MRYILTAAATSTYLHISLNIVGDYRKSNDTSSEV